MQLQIAFSLLMPVILYCIRTCSEAAKACINQDFVPNVTSEDLIWRSWAVEKCCALSGDQRSPKSLEWIYYTCRDIHVTQRLWTLSCLNLRIQLWVQFGLRSCSLTFRKIKLSCWNLGWQTCFASKPLGIPTKIFGVPAVHPSIPHFRELILFRVAESAGFTPNWQTTHWTDHCSVTRDLERQPFTIDLAVTQRK